MLNNPEEAIKNIQKELATYIQQNDIRALVIGVSGGIDSALCCALALNVCLENKTELIGKSIPIVTNAEDEISRGRNIGQAFCTGFAEKDLSDIFKVMVGNTYNLTVSSEDMASKIRKGNIKARLRMIELYDDAQQHGGMVLSTDNYTELMLGFWTLHGDVGDYGMLQNLWKTEVYQLAQYICDNHLDGEARQALQDCIDAKPTDGLGVSNSDLDQLGASSYAEVDKILYDYLNSGLEDNEDHVNHKHPVIQRMLRTEYKRNNPYNIPRVYIEAEEVGV